jgi:hypothetical protein
MIQMRAMQCPIAAACLVAAADPARQTTSARLFFGEAVAPRRTRRLSAFSHAPESDQRVDVGRALTDWVCISQKKGANGATISFADPSHACWPEVCGDKLGVLPAGKWRLKVHRLTAPRTGQAYARRDGLAAGSTSPNVGSRSHRLVAFVFHKARTAPREETPLTPPPARRPRAGPHDSARSRTLQPCPKPPGDGARRAHPA